MLYKNINAAYITIPYFKLYYLFTITETAQLLYKTGTTTIIDQVEKTNRKHKNTTTQLQSSDFQQGWLENWIPTCEIKSKKSILKTLKLIEENIAK